jgi:hypothetical protein
MFKNLVVNASESPTSVMVLGSWKTTHKWYNKKKYPLKCLNDENGFIELRDKGIKNGYHAL